MLIHFNKSMMHFAFYMPIVVLIHLSSSACSGQDGFALIANGDFAKFEEFLDENPGKLNEQNEYGNSLLIHAITHNQPAMIELLLKQDAIDLDLINRQSWSALSASLVHGRPKTAIEILNLGANPNHHPNHDNYTPLMFAVAYQPSNNELIDLMLEKGAEPLGTNSSKSTALHLCCQYGYKDLALKLINHCGDGTDFDVADNAGFTPLLFAYANGNLDAIKALEAVGASSKRRTSDNRSILHLASSQANLDVVKHAFERFKEIDALDAAQRTPLYYSSVHQDGTIADFLINAGADPNAGESKTGYQSPLAMASVYGNEKVVSLLLEHGANVNVANEQQQTPLHFAVNGIYSSWQYHHDPSLRERLDKCIQLLVKYGADVNALNNASKSPIDIALEISAYTAADAMIADSDKSLLKLPEYARDIHWAAKNGMPNTVACLIEGDQSLVNRLDQYGQSPLMTAAYSDNPRSIQILLTQGANPATVDASGQNALHIAAWQGNLAVVELLVHSGIDVDSRSHSGTTPLHAAVWQGHSDIVEYLIQKRANVDLVDSDKFSALHKAVLRGNIEMVKLLVKAGANAQIGDAHGNTPVSMAEGKNLTEIVKFLAASDQ